MRRLVLLLALALPAAADVVVLTDGKTLEGQVSETDQGVQVLFPNGGSAFIPKERVARVEKKPSKVDLYLERRKALAPGDLAGMLELAEWARTQGLDRPAGRLAREVLSKEPGNARAHALLGEVEVCGLFLTPEEAARRGFASLSRGWGDWDQRYAEQEAALGLSPEALDMARAALAVALGSGEEAEHAQAEMSKLPSRDWSLLLHRLPPQVSGPLPSGRLEFRSPGAAASELPVALAWVPPGAEGKELPCLLALPDVADGLEGTYKRWEGAARAKGVVLLCHAKPEALSWLRARGVAVDRNRIVLAGFASGADEAWALLERRADLFASALLVSGASDAAAYPDIGNAAGLGLFVLLGQEDAPQPNRHVREVAQGLIARKGRVSIRDLPGPAREFAPSVLAEALGEALAARRVPWPTRIRLQGFSGGSAAWLRVDALEPAEPPGAPSESLAEARISSHNAVFLSARGVKRLTLSFSDDLLDLTKPVTVTLNGRQVFQGMVAPDLKLMLSRFREDADRHRAVTASLTVESK